MALFRLAFAAGGIAALAGCSLVYDPDELELARDASENGAPRGDAGVDAAPVPADAGTLEVSAIEPRALPLGSGAAGRPVPVVFEGAGYGPDLEIRTVETGEDELAIDIEIADVAASEDGTLAAAALRVHPTEELGEGESLDVPFELSRPGWHPVTRELEILGLDELELAGDVATEDLAGPYSEIVVEADTRFSGSEAVRLEATGPIRVDAALSASAPGGSGDSAIFEPGPGGCPGGDDENEPGRCSPHGGGAGSSSGASGGGGGHEERGDPGEGGSDRGEGGDPVEETVLLAPLVADEDDDDVARGHGGGAGDDGPLESSGVGGGGGGVVELVAGGEIAVGEGGGVYADGADGGSGGANCEGAGGGGSGGAVLIRTGGGLELRGELSAVGGAGGTGCSQEGGDGGDGGIRVDSPQESIPGDSEPAPMRGPMWLEGDLPPIVRSGDLSAGELEISFPARPTQAYALYVDGEVVDDDVPPGTTGTVRAELEPGLREICLQIVMQTRETPSEAENCAEVAYLP